MKDCVLEKSPLDSPWFCTLFQIERDGEEVRTKPGTFVYEGSLRSDSPRPEDSEQLETSAVSLSIDNFSENINRLLWERLNTRILEKDRISLRHQSSIRVSRSLSIGPVLWTIRPPITSMKAGLIKESGSICSR
jgi:hypothetical protein